jgi:hypothetical protein
LAESVLVAKMVQGASITLDRDKFKVFDIVLNNGTRIENINSGSDVDNLLKMAQAESLKDLIESLGGGADLPLGVWAAEGIPPMPILEI